MSRLRFNLLAAAPSPPAAGKLELYARSSDKQLYWIDELGTIVNVVGVDTTDTLTNKTLTSPTINTPTIATPTISSPTITGGTLSATGGTLSAPTITGEILAAGTNSVAPLTFTSGTNLSAAAAGAVEYDGAVFYLTKDTTTGRAVDDSWHYFQLRSTGSGITGIADFFGSNDAIPTVLNAVYEIEWHCYFAITVASTGTSTWTIVNTQTNTNMVANWQATPVAGFATAGAMTGAGVLATTAASVALPASAALTIASHYHKITALVEVGTAGNIRLRQTMSAGTSTPQRGSFFRVRRLPAANVGTFAA